jgi:hypothetical protein
VTDVSYSTEAILIVNQEWRQSVVSNMMGVTGTYWLWGFVRFEEVKWDFTILTTQKATSKI